MTNSTKMPSQMTNEEIEADIACHRASIDRRLREGRGHAEEEIDDDLHDRRIVRDVLDWCRACGYEAKSEPDPDFAKGHVTQPRDWHFHVKVTKR
jgi:hypothetical protein